MKIKALNNENLAVQDLLESIVMREFGGFIERLTFKNESEKGQILRALDLLKTELLRQCSIRKFNLLNTNVVVETAKTIFADTTIRSFYLELIGSLKMTLILNYGKEDYKDILDAVLDAMVQPPVLYDSKPREELNHLNPTDKTFLDFCGQIHVKTATIKNFLQFNEWYYAVILVNFFAQHLLASLEELKEQQPAT